VSRLREVKKMEILELPVNGRITPERRGLGSVPGLDDEELADPAELVRMMYAEFWETVQYVKRGRRREWFLRTY
jgi:hypothetical protein